MSSLSDKSLRYRPSAIPLEEAPTQIILGGDPASFGGALADSHSSTVELHNSAVVRPVRGSSILITPEDKTRISKRVPTDEAPPPIHVGPLESRKSLEGLTLDHFQLEKYVGGGGMGAVYRGRDTRLNRDVAVKILSRDQSDSETVRRFRNEAQSAARLDDPHIARVYYIGEDKGWNFIVFEFIEGINLREIVERRGPLPLEMALDYTLQVSQALAHASERDVVHRDVKPSNVLVTAEGSVKLVDMGLARLHQVESEADDLTQSGVTLGTFDYISPEQARDPRSADVRSDIYSLGCTLYFMLAARAPFPDGTALQKLIRHNSDDPPDVRLFRPDIPEEVVAILMRMLTKKPEQRYQTPAELMLAIERLSQRLQLNLAAASSARFPIKWPPTAQDVAPWWQRLMPLGIAALVLLILAVLPESWPGQASPEVKLPAHGRVSPSFVVEQPLPPEQPDSDAVPSQSVASGGTKGIAGGTLPDQATIPDRVEPTLPTPAAGSTAKTPTTKKVEPDTMPRIDTPGSELLPTPVAAVKQRVIVGASTVDDAVVVPSFAEACRYASQHAEVEEILLAFDGKKTSFVGIEIASQRLTIRAAPDFKPELVFQPSPDAASEDRRLIRLTMPGGHVSWEGVRMRFDVPASRSDWVFFQYAPDAKLDLNRCVLSVDNVSPAMLRSSPQVAFFEPRPRATTTTSNALPDSPAPQLSIKHSVLRGAATVLRLPDDAPVRCEISESFVSTADRILETGGSLSQPAANDAIELSLNRSTVVASSGLLLCGTPSDRMYRLPVQVEQQSCLIVADSAAPVVEYREAKASDELALSFSGSNNFYPRSAVFLRLAAMRDGQLETKDTGFGSLPSWAVELSTFPGTLAAAAPESPSHEQLPSDYVLKSPADTNAGCNLALLPVVEGVVRRPIMGATNMGTMKPDPLAPPMTNEKITAPPAP